MALKTVKYTETINAQLQGLQLDRLLNIQACLTKLVASHDAEVKQIAASALADLEAYSQTLNRERGEREKAKPK